MARNIALREASTGVCVEILPLALEGFELRPVVFQSGKVLRNHLLSEVLFQTTTPFAQCTRII